MGSDFVANLGALYVTFFVAQLSIATKSYPVCTRFMPPSRPDCFQPKLISLHFQHCQISALES